MVKSLFAVLFDLLKESPIEWSHDEFQAISPVYFVDALGMRRINEKQRWKFNTDFRSADHRGSHDCGRDAYDNSIRLSAPRLFDVGG